MVLCRQEQHLEEVIVMKKALVFAGVILLSPIIMAVVDALVGVSFKEEVTLFAWIAHDGIRMLWGAILLAFVQWL